MPVILALPTHSHEPYPSNPGSPARPHVPGATAIGAAFAAMEKRITHLAYSSSKNVTRWSVMSATQKLGFPQAAKLHASSGDAILV